jgi:hypothetical protein
MKIDDIESKKLLPNWAHDADWVQAAFDKIVQIGVGRLPAIDAPLTMQAIQCLTDDELREWYARFGVVEYYPDLNRETREKMLYWIARLYRFLGTPHAIRVLCDYIYNDLPLDVTVIDNLAFDGETLVVPALLDLFDVEIDAGSSGISPANAYRLVNNIMRIARNSQTLRKIIYDYASDIDAPCAPCAYGSAVSVMVSDNDELARVVTPPVVLPTVTEIWTLPNNSSGISTIQSGSANTLWKNTPSWAQIPYDVTSCYAVAFWRKANNTLGGRTEFSTENISDLLAARNVSSNAIEVYWIKVAVCSSNQATVVTVYDSGNTAYNSFKYTIDNNDYYYVLDGTQTDWTDDLSSIGYSLTPSVVLPSVTIYATPSTYCAFNSSGSSVTINAGNSQNMVYYWTGNQYSAIIYDSTKLYSLVSYRNSGTFIGRTGLSCFEYHNPISPSNYLGVANVSSQSITADAFDYATCSDSSATVVTVYDSNNVAYNAFKFTASGTDYYYVLDGTQTDWTDDLASIGYHLPAQYIEVILYLSRTLNTVTFSANDYWASLAETTVSVNALNDFGVPLRTYDNRKFISSTALSDFSFEPIALYDNNDNDVQADMSNFYCAAGPNNPSSDYGNNINIYSINPYQTAVKTWKCRITKL